MIANMRASADRERAAPTVTSDLDQVAISKMSANDDRKRRELVTRDGERFSVLAIRRGDSLQFA